MGDNPGKHNLSVALLSGGVGGARLARALHQVLDPQHLTVVVNVADDEDVYGVRVCPDLDTVTYTLAGIEGPQGWGIAGDTFAAMEQLSMFGVDTTFRLGDRDLASCLYRTLRLAAGARLSEVTAELAKRRDIATRIIPVSDQRIRTRLETADGEWLDFQEYFVQRRHTDAIAQVEFAGASAAEPAPGVIDAISSADLVVIAPSNPVVSIWPVLAVPAVRCVVADHSRVTAISPLFGGAALKGPAADLLRSMGIGEGNKAVAEAYRGVITHLVVDTADAADSGVVERLGIAVDAMPTLLTDPATAAGVAAAMVNAASGAPPRRPA